MKTAKLGAIFLISIMALAGVGTSYAMWCERLDISGTVNTGDLDAAWSVDGVGDDEIVGKDVSWIEALFEGDTLIVTIFNAYPCITYWVDLDIHNSGTIPFDIFWDGVIDQTIPGTVVLTPDPNGEQLHPGERWLGRLEIHLTNDALENTAYHFTTDIICHQWNEVWPPQ